MKRNKGQRAASEAEIRRYAMGAAWKVEAMGGTSDIVACEHQLRHYVKGFFREIRESLRR